MYRNATVKDNLYIEGFIFEQIRDFKYLGVNINEKNSMHKEIRMKLNVANGCYYTMKKWFSSKLLPILYVHAIHNHLCMRNVVYHSRGTKKNYRVSKGIY